MESQKHINSSSSCIFRAYASCGSQSLCAKRHLRVYECILPHTTVATSLATGCFFQNGVTWVAAATENFPSRITTDLFSHNANQCFPRIAFFDTAPRRVNQSRRIPRIEINFATHRTRLGINFQDANFTDFTITSGPKMADADNLHFSTARRWEFHEITPPLWQASSFPGYFQSYRFTNSLPRVASTIKSLPL